MAAEYIRSLKEALPCRSVSLLGGRRLSSNADRPERVGAGSAVTLDPGLV